MTISRCDQAVIRIAAAVAMDERGHTLLVRKRGTEAFMQPGGKIMEGEDPLSALIRELREELRCEIGPDPRPLGRFTAAAANEPRHSVEAELFAVALSGAVELAAEIEEAVWHGPDDDQDRCLAPLTRDHVLPLVRAGMTKGEGPL